MKKWTLFLSMYLGLCLLAACGAGAGGTTPRETLPAGETAQSAAVTMVCRVVDEDDGVVLLAGQDGGAGDVYRLDAKALGGEDLEEGALVEVAYSGDVLETFPAQLAQVTALTVQKEGFDDRCALYLDVLDDLWDVDEGLNADITELGVDLSATGLSAAEQSAVAWAFGQEHGLAPIQGTWEDLADQGYIDREQLQWENGCLFSITEQEQTQVGKQNAVAFDAQKWSSGTGAYFFSDCTAVQNANGHWGEYQVGSEAIS